MKINDNNNRILSYLDYFEISGCIFIKEIP